MKRAVLKTYGKFIGVLISLLGFITGCTRDEESKEVIALYGVPNAEYIVKGNVTNSANGAAINNIRIVMTNTNLSQSSDTTYTDSQGNYTVQVRDYYNSIQTYKVTASDEDGFQNGGVFQSDTLKVQLDHNNKLTNGAGWNNGVYQKTGQNFSLKYSCTVLYGVIATSYKEKDDK
jgi:hypothetical protein